MDFGIPILKTKPKERVYDKLHYTASILRRNGNAMISKGSPARITASKRILVAKSLRSSIL